MTDKDPKQTQPAPSPEDAAKASYKINMTLTRKGRNRLIWLGLVIGAASGLTAVAYRLALQGLEKLRAEVIPGLNGPWPVFFYFAVLLILGSIVCLLVKSEPLIKGSGIPQVEGQLQGYFNPRWLRVLLKKFAGGCLCILGGLSLGREGPSIQLGALAAQGLTEKLNLSRTDQRYLLTCGACAGLSAAFNAPLAGLMFGLGRSRKTFPPGPSSPPSSPRSRRTWCPSCSSVRARLWASPCPPTLCPCSSTGSTCCWGR